MLTCSQNQAVFPRTRLQSRPTYTDRHDQVQVNQSRIEQPPHREIAPAAGIPQGEYTYQEEEMRTTRRYEHESSNETPRSLAFPSTLTSASFHVEFGDNWFRNRSPIARRRRKWQPMSISKAKHPKPHAAVSDPRISPLNTSMHHRNPYARHTQSSSAIQPHTLMMTSPQPSTS